MNCPTCKTAMKPLFTGFFCPKDCDLGPKEPPQEQTWEFSHGGKRWRGRIVHECTNQRGWFMYESPEAVYDSARWSDFVRDPQAFADRVWGDKTAPGWSSRRTEQMDRGDIRIGILLLEEVP